VAQAINIRRANEDDADAIWSMFCAVVREGGAFLEDGSESREEILGKWIAPGVTVFVACADGAVVGAYKLRANQPGYGAHVANGSYMVSAAWRGHHIGRLLGQHSIEAARELGFAGIQYNAVVSTNIGAVRLWTSLGFAIVGRVPGGFRHPVVGEADLLIMHRAV
jgi:L-amino acid N-acyltransferase YncA